MSRRSNAVKKVAIVPPSVLAGLSSFVADHAEDVATMLDCNEGEAGDEALLITKLREVMGVNSLSPEAMLARFFSQEILSQHCQVRLGLSGKGGVPVLAARIAKAWAKPSFVPLPSRKRLLGRDEGEERGGEGGRDRLEGKTAQGGTEDEEEVVDTSTKRLKQ